MARRIQAEKIGQSMPAGFAIWASVSEEFDVQIKA